MNNACFRADTNQQQQAEIHGSQQAIPYVQAQLPQLSIGNVSTLEKWLID